MQLPSRWPEWFHLQIVPSTQAVFSKSPGWAETEPVASGKALPSSLPLLLSTWLKDVMTPGLRRPPDEQWYCGARTPAGFASHLISWKLPGRTSVLSFRQTLNLSAVNRGWRPEISKVKHPTRKQPKRWTALKASDFSLLCEAEVMRNKEQTQRSWHWIAMARHCIAGRAAVRTHFSLSYAKWDLIRFGVGDLFGKLHQQARTCLSRSPLPCFRSQRKNFRQDVFAFSKESLAQNKEAEHSKVCPVFKQDIDKTQSKSEETHTPIIYHVGSPRQFGPIQVFHSPRQMHRKILAGFLCSRTFCRFLVHIVQSATTISKEGCQTEKGNPGWLGLPHL